MKKRIENSIAWLLIFSLMIVLSSCVTDDAANRGEDVTSLSIVSDFSSTELSSEQQIGPDLPDVTYDGYNFRMLTNDFEAMTWSFSTMVVDELIGEPINDAIYNRNKFIEEKYKIKLTEITVKQWQTLDDIAIKSILSGEDAYDIIIHDTREMKDLIIQNLLNEVSNVPYIDINDPWWDENVNKEMSIGGKTYFLAGDYCLAHYDNTCSIFFNNKLLTDLNLTSPYQYIKEGKWTFDAFEEMLKNVSSDLDGDSKYDYNDRYAISSLSFTFFPQLITAAEEYAVKLDDNNMPYINMENERFIEIAQRLDTVFNSDNISFEAIKKGVAHQKSADLFIEGRSLFFSQTISNFRYMRTMADDYGIIPYPKYNESQKDYRTLVFGPPLTAIPITNTNLERTGVILDAMAAESRNELIPAYYKTTLQGKAARDEETISMLDIIFKSRCYDLTTSYWWDMLYGLSEQLASGKGDIVSYVEKNRNNIEKQITEFSEAMISK